MKNDSATIDNKGIKQFKIVSPNRESEETQHTPMNFDDSINNGSGEENIINNKKYKEIKCIQLKYLNLLAKNKQPPSVKTQKRKLSNNEADIFRNDSSDLDSPYQGDDKFELDIGKSFKDKVKSRRYRRKKILFISVSKKRRIHTFG